MSFQSTKARPHSGSGKSAIRRGRPRNKTAKGVNGRPSKAPRGGRKRTPRHGFPSGPSRPRGAKMFRQGMDESSRQHARLIATLKRKAETRGDRQAARFLLQEFANHADAFERCNLPLSDRLVIRFLARAVREILKGKHPKQALCLDAEGRPKIPIERDLHLALGVHDRPVASLQSCRSNASSASKRSRDVVFTGEHTGEVHSFENGRV
jgi:hypothetical protein